MQFFTGSFWWLSFRCCFHWLVVYTNKNDSLIWLVCTNAKMLQQLWTVSRYPEFGGTPICLICSLVKSFNEYYYFKIVSKEKGRFFIMPCLSLVIFSLLWSWLTTLCHASPDIFCPKDKNFEFYNSFPTFWGQKMKFTIHLSLFTVTIHLLLFMALFTSNFCLFKGGLSLSLV